MVTASAAQWQGSLFGLPEEPSAASAAPGRPARTPIGLRREQLAAGAWFELAAGWAPEPDELFCELATLAAWRAERRPMYDRIVDVPRLVAHYEPGQVLPGRALAGLQERIDARYRAELGESLCGIGLCLYRDGRDSVAWHGDTLGRGGTEDTVVAIVSLGAARTFALRPRGGGPSRRLTLGHGDLLAMGGSCQRTWEHAVPKTSAPCGPRISVQFRARGVR